MHSMTIYYDPHAARWAFAFVTHDGDEGNDAAWKVLPKSQGLGWKFESN